MISTPYGPVSRAKSPLIFEHYVQSDAYKRLSDMCKGAITGFATCQAEQAKELFQLSPIREGIAIRTLARGMLSKADDDLQKAMDEVFVQPIAPIENSYDYIMRRTRRYLAIFQHEALEQFVARTGQKTMTMKTSDIVSFPPVLVGIYQDMEIACPAVLANAPGRLVLLRDIAKTKQ